MADDMDDTGLPVDVRGRLRAYYVDGDLQPILDDDEVDVDDPEDVAAPAPGAVFLLDSGRNPSGAPEDVERVPIITAGASSWLYGRNVTGLPWVDPDGDVWLVSVSLSSPMPDGELTVDYTPFGYLFVGGEDDDPPDWVPSPRTETLSLQSEVDPEDSWQNVPDSWHAFDDPWTDVVGRMSEATIARIVDIDPRGDRVLIGLFRDQEAMLCPYYHVVYFLGTGAFELVTDFGEGEFVEVQLEAPVDTAVWICVPHDTDREPPSDLSTRPSKEWVYDRNEYDARVMTRYAAQGRIPVSKVFGDDDDLDEFHIDYRLTSYEASATASVSSSGFGTIYKDDDGEVKPWADINVSTNTSGHHRVEYEVVLTRNGEDWESIGAAVAESSFNGSSSASGEDLIDDGDGDYRVTTSQGSVDLTGESRASIDGHEVVTEPVPPSFAPTVRLPMTSDLWCDSDDEETVIASARAGGTSVPMALADSFSDGVFAETTAGPCVARVDTHYMLQSMTVSITRLLASRASSPHLVSYRATVHLPRRNERYDQGSVWHDEERTGPTLGRWPDDNHAREHMSVPRPIVADIPYNYPLDRKVVGGFPHQDDPGDSYVPDDGDAPVLAVTGWVYRNELD